MEQSFALLKFQNFSSFVDFGFWYELTQQKLEKLKLDDSALVLRGSFSCKGNAGPAQLRIGADSFEIPDTNRGSFQSKGYFINTNTLEQFTQINRKEIMERVSNELKEEMENGDILRQPENLTRFALISFADLKKYKFYFWFSFPCFSTNATATKMEPLQSLLNESQISVFHEIYKDNPMYLAMLKLEGVDKVSVGQLKEGIDSFFGTQEKIFLVGDSSTLEEHPGWNVRNVLYFIARQNVKEFKLILMRDFMRDLKKCKVISVKIEDEKEEFLHNWEKDLKERNKPRMVNLAQQMDSKKLATTAVDLNLKLMKWRLAPEMKLEEISKMKVLLLGSGTLGCNVARGLLGWGCRNITFVDNGKVSFSNPVRQTLFQFSDCLNGGREKAMAAAEAVKSIFPECNAQGFQLSIAMPGHPIPSSEMERAKKDHDMLSNLVQSHDVVFLLTDSREARWLGTVLGNCYDKIVINAALGFDTYLVMRHGNYRSNNLGCYFCSDVVAPTDSLRDRTLDQQCTVTRPGVSFMASSLAVELLISILHSPKGADADADTPTNGTTPNSNNTVGLIPHQIRGFLGSYSNMLIHGHAYDRCTGCSKIVIDAYKEDPFGFLVKVCANSTYLEDITGLSELKNEVVDFDISAVDSDDFSME